MDFALASGGNGSGSKVVFVIIAVVVILGGLVQVIRPDLGWRMSRWQYKDKSALEPSTAGLMAARVGGVVVAAVGIVILVIGLNH